MPSSASRSTTSASTGSPPSSSTATTPSVRLLGRLGFRQEARHVDGVFFKGEWVTSLVFALLEDEWRAGRS